MKRILLILLSLLLVSSVAAAYVQSGHLNQSGTADQVSEGGEDATSDVPSVSSTPDPVNSVDRRRGRGRDPARPTNPVPEPGTMVLASMGLIALGAAARRKRH